jgi:hypothetical protein
MILPQEQHATEAEMYSFLLHPMRPQHHSPPGLIAEPIVEPAKLRHAQARRVVLPPFG